MLLLVSGATRDVMRLRRSPNLGVLTSPRGGNSAQYIRRTGCRWAMDNDAFSKAGFQAEKFTERMDVLRGVPGCLFVCAPDVVGDAVATLSNFYEWELPIAYRGYPVAFVAQDHIEHLPIPWNLFDTLFIGGSTRWKLSRNVAQLVREAKRREKWVHMGRVNSHTRIRYAAAIGCDSVDGTHFSIEPRQIQNKLPTLETTQHALPGVLV